MTGQFREYTTISQGGWKVIFNRNENSEGLQNVITEMIECESPYPPQCINLRSSQNAEVGKFPVNGRWYVFKEFLKRQVLEYLKAFVIGSRARKAWDNGLKLRAYGIGTPAVRAFGEKIFFCVPTRNFLITDFLPDACGIYTFFSTTPFSPGDREAIMKKRSLIRDLGFFIGDLHAKGIFHGDLRLDNILISASADGSFAFSLIDNERNRFFSDGIPDPYRRKNLIQVNMVVLPQITATDRLRFFHAYVQKNPGLMPMMKTWYRDVFSSTRSRLQKKFPGIWERIR